LAKGTIHDDGEHLFAQPAFYAEFAPLENLSNFVDSIYVLKDRGQLTASRLTFASPFRELTFSFRESAASGSRYRGKVVVNEPSFGHRRALFGWIIGIKFKPTWSDPLNTEDHLLTGLLFDDVCHRMTPTHATKAGIRYRYYVSLPCLHGEAKTAKVGSVTRVQEDLLINRAIVRC
jgi:hypothetical protein